VITISHIFYNQHCMLELHKSAWEKHGRGAARYTLIDDGSPEPIPKSFRMKGLAVYRIEEDIAWNIAGARNLAFHVGKTEWVLCADIDHVVTAEALGKILRLDRSDRNVAYIFHRRRQDRGEYGVKGIINILMNRKRYFEVGGHDEDYSGHYGREETFFWDCLERHKVRVVFCEEIVLDWHPRFGETRGLVRDRTFNNAIYDRKTLELQNGTYRNGPRLRFKWKRVGKWAGIFSSLGR
jgi:hypothetical protein